jgi:hypothetical protein
MAHTRINRGGDAIDRAQTHRTCATLAARQDVPVASEKARTTGKTPRHHPADRRDRADRRTP